MSVPLDQSSAVQVVLDNKEWDKVRSACIALLAGDAKRVDGAAWSAYMTGTVLRIDVKVS